MAAKRFEVELPEEVVDGFGWPEAEVPYKVQEALVMELLRRHVISQGKAAGLLQLNRWDLSEVMGRYQVPAIDMTPEEVWHELTKQVRDITTGTMGSSRRKMLADLRLSLDDIEE